MNCFNGRQFREEYSLKMVAKHLRSRKLPYIDVLESRKMQLEHPVVSLLFDAVVTQGDFNKAEEIFRQAIVESLTSEHLRSTELTALWGLLSDTSGRMPCPRAGHQLVLDSTSSRLLLFGGWTGTRSLADLWSYSIYDRRWTCISQDVTASGGPSPRTCHAMVFDRASRALYVLGRFVDPALDASDSLETHRSDFWRCSTAGSTQWQWTELSRNTEVHCGLDAI